MRKEKRLSGITAVDIQLTDEDYAAVKRRADDLNRPVRNYIKTLISADLKQAQDGALSLPHGGLDGSMP